MFAFGWVFAVSFCLAIAMTMFSADKTNIHYVVSNYWTPFMIKLSPTSYGKNKFKKSFTCMTDYIHLLTSLTCSECNIDKNGYQELKSLN